LRGGLEGLDNVFFTKALQLQKKNDTTRKRRLGGGDKAAKESSRHPSLASLAPTVGEGASESPTLENKPEGFPVWQKQEHVELQSPVHPPPMPFNGEGNGYMPQFQWEGQMVCHTYPPSADKEEPGFHIGHLTPAPDTIGNPTYTFPNMTQQSPHLLAALSPESPNLPPGFFGHHNISRASTLPTDDPHVTPFYFDSYSQYLTAECSRHGNSTDSRFKQTPEYCRRTTSLNALPHRRLLP